MSKYEAIKKKIRLLSEAAQRAHDNEMKLIWKMQAFNLRAKMLEMSIDELSKQI